MGKCEGNMGNPSEMEVDMEKSAINSGCSSSHVLSRIDFRNMKTCLAFGPCQFPELDLRS